MCPGGCGYPPDLHQRGPATGRDTTVRTSEGERDVHLRVEWQMTGGGGTAGHILHLCYVCSKESLCIASLQSHFVQ